MLLRGLITCIIIAMVRGDSALRMKDGALGGIPFGSQRQEQGVNKFSNIKDEILGSYQNDNTTDVCLGALTNYTVDLINGKPYAMRAFDSDGKLKSGMMLGAIMSNGQYSECIEIRQETFQGRWCIVSYGSQVTTTATFSIGRSVGVCFPASCTEEFLKEKIAQVNNDTAGIKLNIKCPSQPTKWTAIDILSLFFITIIGSACVSGTAAEIISTWRADQQQDGTLTDQSESDPSISVEQSNLLSKWWQVAMAFSVIKNTRMLVGSYRKDNPLNCLHGMRFLSMTWVILGHVHTTPWLAPVQIISNFGTYINSFLSGTSQVIVNARLSVCTFFVIGGILMTYHGLKRLDFDQPGKKITALYIKRYIRLTPSYALVILITAGIYSKFGGGPLWPEINSYQKQACQKYWWTHLLYINNIYPVKNSGCFPIGWYLATDLQLFLIAPLFILLLLKNKRIGISAMLVSIVASTSVVLVLAIIYKSEPIPIRVGLEAYELDKVLSGGNMTGTDLGRIFPRETIGNDLFRKPWTQFPVYAIGMVVGYVLHESNGKPQISNVVSVVGWLVAIPSAAALVYGLHPYTVIGATPPEVNMAIYEALMKPVWAMAVSWVTLACASGKADPVNWFFGSKYFEPLSKLTFGIYLVHSQIIVWFYGSLEVPIHFSTATFTVIYLAVVVLSIGGGYLIWIGLEAPIFNLIQMLIPKHNESKRHSYGKVEEAEA